MAPNAHADSISLYSPSTGGIADSMSGFSNQSTFTYVAGSTSNPLNLDVTVDYAVFAPGQFSYSPFGMYGQTASDGSFSIGTFNASSSDYVYAYQIFNNSPEDGSGIGLNGLSIGFNQSLPAPVIKTAGESNASLDSTAVPYSFAVLETDATAFDYYPPLSEPIAPGQHSYFLLTSSQYSPVYDSSTLMYGSYLANGSPTGPNGYEYLSSPESLPMASAAGTSPSATPLPPAWKQGLILAAVGLLLARFSRNRLTPVLQKRDL